jgi:hypothetical protein
MGWTRFSCWLDTPLRAQRPVPAPCAHGRRRGAASGHTQRQQPGEEKERASERAAVRLRRYTRVLAPGLQVLADDRVNLRGVDLDFDLAAS